jgi:hypothetical protein
LIFTKPVDEENEDPKEVVDIIDLLSRDFYASVQDRELVFHASREMRDSLEVKAFADLPKVIIE